jgi:predicted ATPase
MKTARLIVKNFGPLKDVNILVTDFLCLIGKQATGKSTIAKLISIFEDENFEKELFGQNLKTYGLDQFMTNDTFISYKIDENNKSSILHFDFIFENNKAILNNFKTYFTHFFEIENLKDITKTSELISEISTHLIKGLIKYDDIFAVEKIGVIIEDLELKIKDFKLFSNDILIRIENNDKEVDWIDKQMNKLSKKALENPSVELRQEINDLRKTQDNLKKNILKIRNDVNEHAKGFEKLIENYYYDIVDFLKLDSQYIPSERSFLHIIAENIFGLINNNIQIPKHLLEIGQEYEKALNVVKEIPLTLIDKKFRYKREGKTSYIYHGLEERVDLLQSASGLQSILPIILLIEYARTLKDNYHFNYVVEEPELNIYPETQHQLIKYLVKNIFNFSENNFQRKKLVITTHSPYILASINNLLLAYQKGIQKPKEVNKIIKKEYWINPKFFNAYELKNGKSYRIVNNKIGQIRSNIIDIVSDSFSEEFDKLLAL